MKCKEQSYDLIGEIWAYPESGIQFSQPFTQMKKYITAADYTPDESTRISIPMKKKSSSLKESPSTDVHGESYGITMTWQMSTVSPDTLQTMERLKYPNNHLIVNTFGNNLMLIRTTEDAYQFQYKEQDGTLFCELTIGNVCGVQRVL